MREGRATAASSYVVHHMYVRTAAASFLLLSGVCGVRNGSGRSMGFRRCGYWRVHKKCSTGGTYHCNEQMGGQHGAQEWNCRGDRAGRGSSPRLTRYRYSMEIDGRCISISGPKQDASWCGTHPQGVLAMHIFLICK